MKIGVLRIGKVDDEVAERVRERLGSDFAGFKAEFAIEKTRANLE
jgi:hypothetical protein